MNKQNKNKTDELRERENDVIRKMQKCYECGNYSEAEELATELKEIRRKMVAEIRIASLDQTK